MTKLDGGCQCDAVRYVAAGDVDQVLACHCSDCQKQTGSAFALIVVIDESKFKVIKGQVKTFVTSADSGRQKLGAFCVHCGGRIYHKIAWRPGKLSLRGGTLDDASWLVPSVHLWTSRKQPWVILPPDAVVFETQPE
ncbi:MAG: GFA family protein [Hyphomicrobiaceae bacterium]